MGTFKCKRGHIGEPYINTKGSPVCRKCRYILSQEYDKKIPSARCTITDCLKDRKGRGLYCSMHYERRRLNGSFETPDNYRKYGSDKLFKRPDTVNVGDRWYLTVHAWVHRRYGKANKCVSPDCDDTSKFFEWSNISGNYYRDISDYQELCAKCHRLYDKNKRENEY